MQLQQGQTLGDYEILGTAGTGGMGVVYKARQRSLDRVVALKVVRPDVADSRQYRERFLREARVAASVDHPHVVTVLHAGELDGQLFLTMQWIDGEDLQRMLRLDGRLSAERAVRIACQVAGALDAVHSAGLVHRDVKPGNVLIRRLGDEDHAYLTDFGVARPRHSTEVLTQSGAVVGTAGYMAPEQIQGGEPTARSDLYALGCLFFEAISGRPPFQGDNELALLWAHANSPRPVLSSVLPSRDSRFDEFMPVAMAVNPAERFASGREMAKALTSAYEHQPEAPPAATTIEHVPTGEVPTRSSPTPAAGVTPAAEVTPAAAVTPGPPITPLPPTQQTPADFPAYGYVTPGPPPSAPPPRERRSNSLAVILLGLVALAGIGVGALAAAGAFNQSSVTTTRTGVSTPTTTARQSSTSKTTTSGPSGVALKQCSGDVLVRQDTTSCAFGENVEKAYLQTSGGTTDVVAYSPVTHATYTMHCTGGSPHVCTGGSNSEVQFTSNPSSSTVSLPGPPSGSLKRCDQNIQADKSTTSCGFAKNVFVAYWNNYKANGAQSNATVIASSPATGRTYTMNCASDGTNVVCTGGNSAYVTFPLQAVRVYAGP